MKSILACIAAAFPGLAVAGRRRPDCWDLIGASACLVGADIILFAPHRAPKRMS
jgi:small multidrug resistance family-3 protein